MESVQEYKIKIDSIIDRLPRAKVEEEKKVPGEIYTKYLDQYLIFFIQMSQEE